MKRKEKNVKCTSIGGQAVLEGVMMRGKSSMAIAVRDGDGVIRLEAKRLEPVEKKNKFFGLPIVRGVVSFFNSLVTGTQITMRSAEVYGAEDGEPSKFEKWLSEKLHVELMSLVLGLGVFLGLAFSIALFVILPNFAGDLIRYLVPKMPRILVNLCEGLVRILIFVIYILLTSLLSDIKRTYMYHGAEHKTISCYESGEELTVENARTKTRVHNRCGTTFLFFVMIVSILVYSVFEAIFGKILPLNNVFVKLISKIILLPLIAGLSYELLKGLAKTNNPIFYPLKAPGLLLQRLTTKEPTDDMLEVAITAFKKVLALEENQEESTCEFVCAMTLDKLYLKVKEILSSLETFEESDIEWIISIALNKKRSEIDKTSKEIISNSNVEKILNYAKERATNKPLWYVFGDCDFYGLKIKVNENVLIPRPETEELVFNAIKDIDENSEVLDMCTGSGAIAIAVKKKTNAKVTAVDISKNALEVAKENAIINDAEIEFIESDLFENVNGEYDVIISNPPYIKSEDIKSLDKSVRDFEPLLALDGGESGLDYYCKIFENCTKYLKNCGKLYLEIGYNQGEEIAKIFSEKFQTEIIKDVNGNDRIIKAVLR